MQRIIAFSLAFLVALGLAPLAQAQTPLAVAPLLGSVVRPFDPPAAAWLAGHRGVDLGGTVGLTVVAALDGVVFFAGMVAGRPVISLRHGDRATTYEPVEASVSAGQIVR
ncbi:MAG: M23 family metallopeptidase, partial [Propionibacteriaceae bacterium]|nr:M23 family metallopeptidase [Propionibacteriaceae bacterium]